MAGIDISKKKKIGFVCSGGAVKAAAFHVGVASSLEYLGFRFNGGWGAKNSPELYSFDPSKTIQVYVGSSAGCLVTTYLAQGGGMKELEAIFNSGPKDNDDMPLIKYWEMVAPRFKTATNLFGPENFILNLLKMKKIQSPFSTDGIVRYFDNNIIHTNKFSEIHADLCIVGTDVNTGRKLVFSKYQSAPKDRFAEYRNDVSVTDACAASMSLPPIYQPYPIQLDGVKRDIYDGEIKEPLNVHIASDLDCDLIISSYTHQPVRMSARKGSLSEKGIQAITLQAIYHMIERKIQSARGYRREEKQLVDVVKDFFDKHHLGKDLLDTLVEELEARMTFKSHIDYIYIHPKPSDFEMFSLPHFSLNRRKMERIVKKGFLAGYSVLRGLMQDS